MNFPRPEEKSRPRPDDTLINFIAKFDVDEMETDLTLQADDYDLSPSAEYESWLLLEEAPTAGVQLALE